MRQPHKMVKDTQTIRRLLSTSCLNVFDHFVELALICIIFSSSESFISNLKVIFILYYFFHQVIDLQNL